MLHGVSSAKIAWQTVYHSHVGQMSGNMGIYTRIMFFSHQIAELLGGGATLHPSRLFTLQISVGSRRVNFNPKPN